MTAKEVRNVSYLTRKGDNLCKEKKYRKALQCYKRAIKLDEYNLQLLIRKVQVYFDLNKHRKCIKEAEKLIALCSNKERYTSEEAIKALSLIARSLVRLPSPRCLSRNKTEKVKVAFAQAMHCVPANEAEVLLLEHNKWMKGCTNFLATSKELKCSKAFEAGIMLYNYGNGMDAIGEFSKAISYNKWYQPAYAYRAVCYAGYAGFERDLSSNVKECINLDYRFHHYFLMTANEFKLLGQIDASFRLYRALSSSFREYVASGGRFFPKLLDNKQLSQSENKRFKDLDESWRVNHLIRLVQVYPIFKFDFHTYFERKATEEREKATNDNAEDSRSREEADKLLGDKKFDEDPTSKQTKPIEQGDLERLSRAKNYFIVKKYSECINEATNLVVASSEKEKYKSIVVFEALKLIAASHGSSKRFSDAKKACIEAMRFSVPTAKIERLISDYNMWNRRSKSNRDKIDRLTSNANLHAGIQLDSRNDSLEAYSKFGAAIKLDGSNPLAYACRALCYSVQAYHKKHVCSDVRECIELDYRYLDYFINKADKWRLDGQGDASLRLYEALSSQSVEDAYKLSVGKFFPSLFRNERLNDSERKRFKELEESWRKSYFPTLEKLNQKSDHSN